MEADSLAGPIIMVAVAIGVPLCLLVAFIVGIGGISGSRDPLFSVLLALGAIGFPIIGVALLRGASTVMRTIMAVILGALPLAFVATALFRIF